MARYAIGVLYQPPVGAKPTDSSDNSSLENSRGTIVGLEAVNFITVATPHLGSRGNKQVTDFSFSAPSKSFSSFFFKKKII